MSDAAIKRALEVATRARCFAAIPLLERDKGACEIPCGSCEHETAAAIAVFLEAMPVPYWADDAMPPDKLAAAVRRAAGGGG